MLAVAGLLCGCSGDSGWFGSSLTTQSVNPPPPQVQQVQAPKVDPSCAPLAARIEALRREGVTDRIEKASVGKTANVSVKRASLAQVAELDKANAEFQARCSTLGPRPMQAQLAPPLGTSTAIVSPNTAPATTGAIVPPVVTPQKP
jgi:hypothetical protein